MIEIFGQQIDRYIFAILIFIFFQFFRAVLRKLAYKIVQKTSSKFDDEVLESVEKPVDFLFIIIGAYFALEILPLSGDIKQFLGQIIRSGFIIVLFWGILNFLTIQKNVIRLRSESIRLHTK